MDEKINDILKTLPDSTGVYLMKDADAQILYVGKANSLKKRVSSYFRKNSDLGFKEKMIPLINDIEFLLCESEAKALLLEASLIKKHQPRFNVLLRDDKSFPYVWISDEDFARLAIVRNKKEKSGKYFGPFLSSNDIKAVLELLRKIFPYRTCKSMPKKACLYNHINLCPAPCEGKVDKEIYAQTVEMISYVLSGDKERLEEFIKLHMEEASDRLEYERAAYFRDKLETVYSLYGVRKEFKEILALQRVLALDKMPIHIECIDISGIQFTDTCGSLVVFENGLPNKKKYRRYKIKEPSRDDFRMVEEVVLRRLRRLKSEKRKIADLLIIDGGQIQVEFAVAARDRVGVDLPIIGLAKKHEEIWKEGAKLPIRLDRSDPALRLIQRLRDEAHRFVNNYHKNLRKKRMFGGENK